MIDWDREEAPPALDPPPKPRLLAPGGIPYTSHETLVARVEEERRQRAGVARGPGWEVTYRSKKGKVILFLSKSEAKRDQDAIAILFTQKIRIEDIIRLREVE